MQKNQFSKGILWRPFVEQKTEETFVSLNDEVTKAWHLLLVVRIDTSLIIQISMLTSYCCCVSTSE